MEHADRGLLKAGGREQDLRGISPADARDLGLHFVHQEGSVFGNLTITENLSIGNSFASGPLQRIRWRHARRQAARVLERFQIAAHPDQLLSEVGPATQTMIAIARTLQDQADASRRILVLDEPTASLPAPEVKALLDALCRYAENGQSIIYVTHRLEEIIAVGNRTTLLRDGKAVATVSPRSLGHDDMVELMGRTVKQIERTRGAAKGGEVLSVDDLRSGSVQG